MTMKIILVEYVKKWWNHVGFQKYFKNMGWVLFARVLSFLTSFFTMAVVARYLGPENLGKLDYAQSFVAIISVFASLGIDQILYRDLIVHPEKENDFLGTAIFSKLFFGLIAFVLSLVISFVLKNEPVLTILIGICSLTFVISPIGTVGILFSSQVKSKYSSQVSILLAILIPILKIGVVFLDKGIIYFASIIFIEALISVVWSMYVYRKCFNGHPTLWRFRLNVFKQLMIDSWPLLLAGFSGYVYAKIDQVMILHYIDSVTVGVYAAAVKLTQVWAFLPGLIIGSLFPAIINAKKNDFNSYARRFRALSAITVGITILIASPLFIFSSFFINLIFGNDFIGAAPILRIYLWTSVAITLVILVQHYLIAEKLSRIFLYTSIIGAISNVILNMMFIPLYGAKGSAFGTLLSYLFVVFSVFIFKKSRDGILNIFSKVNIIRV